MFGLEFKDYPNTDTPIDAENLNKMQRNLLDLIYPVGRGFIDFTDTDYSDYLGFEWERELIGMVAVGKDETQTEFNTIGKTGGAKTHTLTVAELPKFRPSAITNSTAGGDWGTLAMGTAGGTSKNNPFDEIGGGQAHNNLPPYKVVNYWKRVA